MTKPAENTVTDLFCGAGGSSEGALAAGAELVFAINHWDLAVENHNQLFPEANHALTDVRRLSERRIRGYPDSAILLASPECFPAGTMILTRKGWLGIEEVMPGDEVLTHRNRWRPVVRKQSRIASTVIVHGQGHTPGIEVTPNHRFWARGSRYFNTRKNSRPVYGRELFEPDWIPADDLLDQEARWSTPVTHPEQLAPDVPPGFGPGKHTTECTPGEATEAVADQWWLIGRYLGDGSLTFGKNAEVQMSCGFHEADELRARLFVTGTRWHESRKRTATVFTLWSRELRDWLFKYFGRGASGKTMPGEVYGIPELYRRALLDGYVSADGNVGRRRVQVDTVSHRLALSVRLLAESLGHRASLHLYDQRADVIEGRKVNVLPLWRVAWEKTPTTREAIEDGGMSWSAVKDVTPGRPNVEVWNMEVEEDHSYVAEGIVVKNCVNHSLAKGAETRKQQNPTLFDETGNPVDPELAELGPPGTDEAERSRSTMVDVARFAEQKMDKGRPYLGIITENVVCVTKWGVGNDGRHFKRWLNRILKLGYEHEMLWINSMFAPPMVVPTNGGSRPVFVPQSRDRIYIVFWLKGLRRPDFSLEPPSWCPYCEAVVGGRQTFKRTDRPAWGRYGPQYYYSCPRCHKTVFPGAAPAATAIDFSLPITPIGERERPLKPATIERIRRGLERLASEPFAVRLTHRGSPKPLTLPLITQTTRHDTAVVVPVSANTHENSRGNRARDAAVQPAATVHASLDRALVTPNTEHAVPTPADRGPTRTLRTEGGLSLITRTSHKGGNGSYARDGDEAPLFGVTSAHDLALVVGNRTNGVPRGADREPSQTVCTGETIGIVELQRNGSARPAAEDPAHTVRARGQHHGVVVSNYSPGWTRDAGRLPIGSVTTQDGHALALPYSTKGKPKTAGREPADTVTTMEKQALVVPYYSNGRPGPAATEATPTLSTRDRVALLVPPLLDPEAPTPAADPVDEATIDKCGFRMFSLDEISRAMAMEVRHDGTTYVLSGNKRSRMKMYGNAVTPPVMAFIVGRLLAAIDLPR